MIETFVQYAENHHKAVKDWMQAKSRNVFGYLTCQSPEEILFAADVLPVRIFGTGEPLELADEYVPPNSCPFCRSCLDAGLRGHYDYLEGVVIPNSCDIVFFMEYFWKTHVPRPHKPSMIFGKDINPYVYYINYPEKITGREVVPYYLEVLKGFKQDIERTLNRTISDDDLSRSIAVYNENKAQMRRMYEMRKSDPPALSGYEAWQITYAGLLMPKDEHTVLLKEYLDSLEASEQKAPGGVRIYLSGSAMDHVNAEIYKVIEDSGVVVSDDLSVGTQSFWEFLDTDIPPMEAIARRSLSVSNPRSTVTEPVPEHRWEHIVKTMKDFDAEGAIFYNLKCCDARMAEFPHLRDKIREEFNIPVLFLEGDYTTEGVEQMRSRIEAFIEMIEG